MPRRSNTGPQNSINRSEARVNILTRNQNLRNMVRNVSNLLRRDNVSRMRKQMAKNQLVIHAVQVFSRYNARNALPMRASTIVDKLIEAWPHAVGRSGRSVPRRTSPRRQASPKRHSVTVSPFRNAALAKGPNGKPILVYFPNNKN